MGMGEGKTWYGVPAESAVEFERVLLDVATAMAAEDPAGKAVVSHDRVALKSPVDKDLLYQMLMVAPPSQLQARGVQVCRTFQEAGEFVVTFPQAYHAGFSHGLNVAEACNFATVDWLPYGRRSVEKYRGSGSVERGLCFSHEALLCDLAHNLPDHSPRVWGVILAELAHMLATEERERAELAERGTAGLVHLANSGSDPRYDCCKCRHICHLSAVVCRCEPVRRSKKVACMRHAADLCGCAPAQRLLVCWAPLEALRALVASVQEAVARTDSGGAHGPGAAPDR